MKKVYISPVASFLMSLSLALGILVSDLSGFSHLTRAQAQESGSCGSVSSSTVVINSGVTDGVLVRDIVVNGEMIAQGVIAGSVTIINSSVESANGVLVGGGDSSETNSSGVLVGGGDNTSSGSGSGSPCVNGVLVGGGDGAATTSGVLVGGGDKAESGQVSVDGADVNTSSTFVGGILTGDNIVVTDGVITGQNLLLSGATIDGGSINGTVTAVRITPAN